MEGEPQEGGERVLKRRNGIRTVGTRGISMGVDMRAGSRQGCFLSWPLLHIHDMRCACGEHI